MKLYTQQYHDIAYISESIHTNMSDWRLQAKHNWYLFWFSDSILDSCFTVYKRARLYVHMSFVIKKTVSKYIHELSICMYLVLKW